MKIALAFRMCFVIVLATGWNDLYLQAQPRALPEVEFDLGSGTFKNELPFDEPFFVKIKAPAWVDKISIKRRCLPLSCGFNFDKIYPLSWLNRASAKSGKKVAEWERINDKGKQTIALIQVDKLAPRVDYRFDIVCTGAKTKNVDEKTIKDERKTVEKIKISNNKDSTYTHVKTETKDGKKPTKKAAELKKMTISYGNQKPHISLDIGVGIAYAGGNLDNFGFTYAALNLSLTPVNSDVGYQWFRFDKRLSMMAGLTLGGVESDDKRKDYFSGGSLLIGGSYRILAGVKVTFGGLWYREVNAHPLIKDDHRRFDPYIAFSIGDEVSKLIAVIKDIFP